MDNIKVFELAKQLGMETIALMDKLREFKIPIKSHMAELDDNLLQQIRSRFDEEKAKTSSKTTKTTKRKVTAAAPATPKVVKASQVAVPAPTTTKKAAVKTAAKAPAAKSAKATPAVAAKSSRTVIRRKANVQDAGDIEGAAEFSAPEATQDFQEPTNIEETDLVETVDASETIEKPQSPKTDSQGGRVAQVISRMDLRTTMGERAPQSRKPTEPQSATSTGTSEQAAAQARAASQANLEVHKFDRDAIGKLIKQEALVQAKKAAALARETKIETFNASDFRKREMLFQPKKKKTLTGRAAQKPQITTPGAAKRKIKIKGSVTVSQLAQAMSVKNNAVLKKLIAMGSMVTVNDVLDFETALVLASEYGFEIENLDLSEEQLIVKAQATETNPENLTTRPPVVTVMGHVDHGKTSLLDVIRQANVASGEAGGITQHIGAYSVVVNGKRITFLDTPGHEAFTAMRARGAKVTDIVILVVAADDGIMPQTKEAILHAKSAGVPIIVAVNKMDLPQANPQRVLQGLTEFELVPEEWGGSTIVAKVSAAKKEGIKELLEMVLLQAEVLELKADAKRPASGTVIEARLDRGRGPVATVLIQQGTAVVGDIIVAGITTGRIRAMINDRGQQIKQAGPGDPVEILGLNAVPAAGDTADIAKNEEVAQEIVEKRKSKFKAGPAMPAMKMTLEDLFAKVQTSDVKELSVLVKADVQGSAEALKELINKMPADQVKVKVIASTVGGITESDVLLASASNAVIIGFNVRPETGVNSVAQREGIEIKTYSIIYEVVDDIKKAMTGLLSPTFVEKTLGRAEVRSLFSVPKFGTIAGCSVSDGKITRQASVRLLRESRIIYEGKLSSLKRFKDDVKEVQTGYECGIAIENYNDMKVGDVIEAFMKEQVATLLN
ncbi:MAG: translation initiation factor IF-2 [Oligoflexia bacterium]|nr:translation initiation factor IF-2 [Oligoflexia bacterium]